MRAGRAVIVAVYLTVMSIVEGRLLIGFDPTWSVEHGRVQLSFVSLPQIDKQSDYHSLQQTEIKSTMTKSDADIKGDRILKKSRALRAKAASRVNEKKRKSSEILMTVDHQEDSLGDEKTVLEAVIDNNTDKEERDTSKSEDKKKKQTGELLWDDDTDKGNKVQKKYSSDRTGPQQITPVNDRARWGLEYSVEKALAQDIYHAGGIKKSIGPRYSRTLSQILAKRPDIYGYPGDRIRKQITNKCTHWKTFSTKKFKKVVLKRYIDDYVDSDKEEEITESKEKPPVQEDTQVENKEPGAKDGYIVVCHYKPKGSDTFRDWFRVNNIAANIKLGEIADQFAEQAVNSEGQKFDLIYEGRMLPRTETLPDLGFFDMKRAIHVNMRPTADTDNVSNEN